MAALDFPPSPLINDKYPVPAVPGVPQYTFDGVKWTTVGPQITNAKAADAAPLMDAATAAIGTATDYAREDHVHPSDTSRASLTQAVRYDAVQTATEAQKVQARQNVYAAPFDALAYSGMQINGSMDVSQELGGTGTNISGAAVCDGWRLFKTGTMAVNVAGGVSATGYFSGFPCLFFATVATAQTTITPSDLVLFVHYIEGWRIARLAWGTASAKPVTIGFWTAHARAGTYSGTIRNLAGSRSYAFTYTQNAAGVAQYNTVTITGCPDGVWETGNLTGMRITFAMACGSTNTAPSANSWLTGDYFAAPGQINGVAATSDAFRLTGVVVLPGIEAPSAERSPLIMRPYDQELVTCQRYFRPIEMNGPIICIDAAKLSFNSHYNMRAAPAIILKNLLGVYANGADRVQSALSCSFVTTPTEIAGLITCENFTGLAPGGTAVRSGNLAVGPISWLNARL
jgi:hypothetical protein